MRNSQTQRAGCSTRQGPCNSNFRVSRVSTQTFTRRCAASTLFRAAHVLPTCFRACRNAAIAVAIRQRGNLCSCAQDGVQLRSISWSWCSNVRLGASATAASARAKRSTLRQFNNSIIEHSRSLCGAFSYTG